MKAILKCSRLAVFPLFIIINTVLVQTFVISHLDYADNFLTSFSFLSCGCHRAATGCFCKGNLCMTDSPLASYPFKAGVVLRVHLTLDEKQHQCELCSVPFTIIS